MAPIGLTEARGKNLIVAFTPSSEHRRARAESLPRSTVVILGRRAACSAEEA